jgi:hypothetical protein
VITMISREKKIFVFCLLISWCMLLYCLVWTRIPPSQLCESQKVTKRESSAWGYNWTVTGEHNYRELVLKAGGWTTFYWKRNQHVSRLYPYFLLCSYSSPSQNVGNVASGRSVRNFVASFPEIRYLSITF